MRKYFNSTALESEDDQEILEDDDLLADATPDEEAVIAQEAMDDAAGAESELSDAERIIEVSDALEDLAVIADGIEEATPTEIALIENTGNMAVAGSDVDPEEIVPAMESFKGGRIATEGIVETARQIWESILRFLKSIWEKIEGFFYKVLGSIPMLRRKLEALKVRIGETNSQYADAVAKGKGEKDKQVGLLLPTNALSINYVPVGNANDIQKGLTGLSNAIDYVFKDYMGSVAEQGKAIESAISAFDPNKPEEAMHQMRLTLKTHKVKAIPGGTASKRFPEFDTMVGHALFGNVSLAMKVYNDKKEDASALGALDRYRRSGMELVPTSVKSHEPRANIRIAPLSTGDMESMVKEMLGILNILEEYKRGSVSKNLMTVKKSIESASDKASTAMQKIKKSEGTSGETKEGKDARNKADAMGHSAAVPYYRSLLNFNTAYARWVKDPAIPLLGHSLTVIRAIATLIDRSCATYPGKGKAPTAKGLN